MPNSWWEIQILCELDLEESVFWRLEKFGCSGTATEVKGKSCLLRAYLPQVKAQLLDLAALSLWLRQDAINLGLPKPMMNWHLIDEEDWGKQLETTLGTPRNWRSLFDLSCLVTLSRSHTEEYYHS